VGWVSGRGAGRTQAQHPPAGGFLFHLGYFMKRVILGRISLFFTSTTRSEWAPTPSNPSPLPPDPSPLLLHGMEHTPTHPVPLHAPTLTQPPSHHLSVPFSLPSPAHGGGTEPPCHCQRGTGGCAALPVVPLQGCSEFRHQMDPAAVLWDCAPLPKWIGPGSDGGI